MRNRRFHISLPKGLLARTTLIVLVPIIILQIGFAVLLSERHSAGITKAMSRNTAYEINYIIKEINASPDKSTAQMRAGALGRDFAMRVTFSAPPKEYTRYFYDFSGRFIVDTLRDSLPSLRAIDLTSGKMLALGAETSHGVVKIIINRDRLSPANAHQLFVWAFSVGILLSAIALIFLRNQLRPIRRLAEVSKDFGQGKMSPIQVRGAREVRAAIQAFLSMRNQIEAQIAQHTRMLSGVSHDLRTPLTRLKLGLSMLDEQEATELLRDVADMQALIESFLQFAQQSLSEQPQYVDLKDFIQNYLATYQTASPSISCDIKENAKISLRALSVRRALDNLIKNALRYGTKVHIEAFCRDDKITIRVEDNGTGIAEEVREHALMPFTRLDAARNQDKGSGVGLGLAIVDDIAKNHDGALNLGTSEKLGGLCAELVLASLSQNKADKKTKKTIEI